MKKLKRKTKLFFSVVQLFEIAIGTIIPELLLRYQQLFFVDFFFFFVVELQLSMYAEEEKGPSLPSSYCTR